MKKQKKNGVRTAPAQPQERMVAEKDLGWVMGGSGYVTSDGRDGDPPPDPTGGS